MFIHTRTERNGSARWFTAGRLQGLCGLKTNLLYLRTTLFLTATENLNGVILREDFLMNKGYIFPLVLITLDLCAGVVYLASGDVRKFVYWIAAAVLNIAVTF